MPLYEYSCKKCGHRFERLLRHTNDIVKECPVCGGEVERLISASAVQFKGSGFYSTDYGAKPLRPASFCRWAGRGVCFRWSGHVLRKGAPAKDLKLLRISRASQQACRWRLLSCSCGGELRRRICSQQLLGDTMPAARKQSEVYPARRPRRSQPKRPLQKTARKISA